MSEEPSVGEQRIIEILHLLPKHLPKAKHADRAGQRFLGIRGANLQLTGVCGYETPTMGPEGNARAELSFIAIHRDYRNQGLGLLSLRARIRLMVEQALLIPEGAVNLKIRAETHITNTAPAHLLGEVMGFQKVDVVQSYQQWMLTRPLRVVVDLQVPPKA